MDDDTKGSVSVSLLKKEEDSVYSRGAFDSPANQKSRESDIVEENKVAAPCGTKVPPKHTTAQT